MLPDGDSPVCPGRSDPTPATDSEQGLATVSARERRQRDARWLSRDD